MRLAICERNRYYIRIFLCCTLCPTVRVSLSGVGTLLTPATPSRILLYFWSVAFLSGDLSRKVTATTLAVDGSLRESLMRRGY